jgi:hypothetical protein
MASNFDCDICEKTNIGFGNNANPVIDGRCCDYCNVMVVLPARLGIPPRTPEAEAKIKRIIEQYG